MFFEPITKQNFFILLNMNKKAKIFIKSITCQERFLLDIYNKILILIYCLNKLFIRKKNACRPFINKIAFKF